jgi:hypothetical protein
MKYSIIGFFENKNFKSNEMTCYVNVLEKKSNLDGLLNKLKNIGVYPTEISVDLLFLSMLVYSADKRLNRKQISENSWTREIYLELPVSDPKKWNQVKDLICEMLNFLTGDFWQISFSSRPVKYKNLVKEQPGSLFTNDIVSLFSGGLDSLIGMIDLLETVKSPIFASFAGEGKISTTQKNILNDVKIYTNKELNHIRFNFFPYNMFDGLNDDNTTRGRSFLFFALGVFIASGFKDPFKLLVPENGFIALNIPLDITRIGSLTTRTTHPYYMFLWNKLLKGLDLKGSIENPYWNKTKGEMIADVKNPDLLKKLIKLSVSCSSPSSGRWYGNAAISHCGHCVPCIIRQAAIYAAWNTDPTDYKIKDIKMATLNSKKSQGINVRSFQYAIDRLKRSKGIERNLIFTQGSLSHDLPKLNDYIDVYKRGLSEVYALLLKTKSIPK